MKMPSDLFKDFDWTTEYLARDERGNAVMQSSVLAVSLCAVGACRRWEDDEKPGFNRILSACVTSLWT